MNEAGPRFFVCYIPGLDRRRISVQAAPFLHALMERHGWVTLETLPTTEQVPMLLTGTYPHENWIWQVSRKSQLSSAGWDRLLEWLPDWLTTTLQLFHHFRQSTYDLAAIPWRRRRQFDLHRIKYNRRVESGSTLEMIGRMPTLFKVLRGQSRYLFVKDFERLTRSLPDLPAADVALEFLEFYGFDLFSHWHLDQPAQMADKLHFVDRAIAVLHAQCRERGVTLVVLTDHGQEPITGQINLARELRRTGVPEREYLYYNEVAAVRFWFRTERAREVIGRMLTALDHVTVLTYRQMHDHHVCFDDDSFGELYGFADHGYVFFPHDFHHPLANLFLGLRHPLLRPRIRNPRHRGNHGHLPDHPAEAGFMLVADDRYTAAAQRMSVIDFSPTMLTLLHCDTPPAMHGEAVYRVLSPVGGAGANAGGA